MSTVNSYGVPSLDWEEWQADVRIACRSVAADQLLIVSFVGDYETFHTVEELAHDFAVCARRVVDAGAYAIEANLSCPNFIEPTTGKTKDRLCEHPDVAKTIVSAIREELSTSDFRLVVKLGSMADRTHREVVTALDGLIDGIAGINTLPVDVVDPYGNPIWEDRESRGGLSGFAIKHLALDFVSKTAMLREELGSAWDILGIGGVTSASDFVDLYDAGADAVLAATGVYSNPLLAQECIDRLGRTLSINAGTSTIFAPDRVEQRLLENLDDETDVVTLAERAAVPASIVSENIPRLVDSGVLRLRSDRLRGRLVRRA